MDDELLDVLRRAVAKIGVLQMAVAHLAAASPKRDAILGELDGFGATQEVCAPPHLEAAADELHRLIMVCASSSRG